MFVFPPEADAVKCEDQQTLGVADGVSAYRDGVLTNLRARFNASTIVFFHGELELAPCAQELRALLDRLARLPPRKVEPREPESEHPPDRFTYRTAWLAAEGHERHRLALGIYVEERLAGLVLFERDPARAPFSAAEGELLLELAPLVAMGVWAQAERNEVARRTTVLRALLPAQRMLLVADLDRRRIVWGMGACSGGDWRATIEPMVDSILEAAAASFDGSSHLRTDQPDRRALMRVVPVRRISGGPFSSTRCVLVQVDIEVAARVSSLSPREREIAVILSDGYSVTNAAAILEVSENTIRTYVRRLYAKLGITNRTDLVRSLFAVHAPDT